VAPLLVVVGNEGFNFLFERFTVPTFIIAIREHAVKSGPPSLSYVKEDESIHGVLCPKFPIEKGCGSLEIASFCYDCIIVAGAVLLLSLGQI
jgi:hypothetical protein